MATFMEEFVKRFRFSGFGTAGEKNSFTGSDGSVNRYLPVFVMGKTFNFAVETDEEYAALPVAGTPLLIQGHLKRRKSAKGLTGSLENLIHNGKPGWRAPSEQEFLAGLRFEGCGVVTLKRGGIYAGSEFRNVQVASLGDTLVFSHVDAEIFDRIQENAQAMFGGRLDTQVVSSSNFVSDELIPVIQHYQPFTTEQKQAEPQKKTNAA